MKKYFLIIIGISTSALGQLKQSKNQNCLLLKESETKKLNSNTMTKIEKNVLGTNLEMASLNPLTGFYRDGYCSTGIDDKGIHVVAAVMTDEFLNYSKKQGNDLITPNLKYGFQGLKKGDIWCLCAKRWHDAFKDKVAPPVILKATNEKALDYISINDLKLNSTK